MGVLEKTYPLLSNKLKCLNEKGKIKSDSKICYINDGSNDDTWSEILMLSKNDNVEGISLSRNEGHQNALLAGLMEAMNYCDVTISIDCDGQDDINAIDEMIDNYLKGDEIVYGVRSSRKKDTFFKRFTAQGFYKVLKKMGVETVYNHADYRLMSKKALEALSKYKEVNVFLRGMVPLVGFPSSSVYYERDERIYGQSHYPLSKMIHLAVEGITGLSIKPLRFASGLGFIFSIGGFVGVLWAIVTEMLGKAVVGWASMACIVCFMGGIQLLCLGIMGEYIGKIYLETKERPRYIISQKTYEDD